MPVGEGRTIQSLGEGLKEEGALSSGKRSLEPQPVPICGHQLQPRLDDTAEDFTANFTDVAPPREGAGGGREPVTLPGLSCSQENVHINMYKYMYVRKTYI